MDELLLHGIRPFNDGVYFQCHEVLKEAWTPEREAAGRRGRRGLIDFCPRQEYRWRILRDRAGDSIRPVRFLPNGGFDESA